jgi:site-specific DNA recombinase
VADVAPMREAEAELRDRLAILGEDFAAGAIDRATMHAASRSLREQLSTVEAEIAKAGRVEAIAGVDVEHLAESWDELSLDDQRAIVRSAFASIRIVSRGKGRVAPKREHMPVKFAPEWR